MRRFMLIAAGCGLVLAVPFLSYLHDATAQRAVTDAQRAKAGRALTGLRSEADRARERAAALDRQAAAALRASDRATLSTAALAARVQQAEADLASAETDLVSVKSQRRGLDAALARERAPAVQLLAGLQLQARRPPLLEVLQPGSLQDTVHLRAILAAVAPQIGERTAGLRASLGRARNLELRAARITSQRRALQAELLTRRKQLVALSAAERIKARRAAGSADREAERAYAIGEEARDLSTLIARLQAGSGDRATAHSAQAVNRPGAAAATRFHLPVEGKFDPTTASPGKGVSLIPRPAAIVVAPGNGRVAFAGPYRGYGAIVIIEHPDGWTSLLTGLAVTQVAVGQMLVAGSPIGQASARDPRITFELRRNGEPTNPLDQLR